MSEIPHARLGTTEIPISRFILGTGNFGGSATVTGPGIGLDEEQSGALIDRSLELGVTVLDSADVYCGGASERIIGAWHERHPDSGVVITTKTGFTKDGPNLKPDRLRSQIDKSRKILGRIDLFLPHTVDPNTPWSESLPVLSDAVDQGLIRAYGLSNVTEQDLSSALETADSLGIRRPQLIQNRYSLIARDDDEGVLPIARAESISFTPYSPLQPASSPDGTSTANKQRTAAASAPRPRPRAQSTTRLSWTRFAASTTSAGRTASTPPSWP